jgi:hypothetical protein
LPLIGQARAFARDPLAFLVGVADKYGDISTFRLGRMEIFFVRHPDLVKEVLITQRANFTMTSLDGLPRRVHDVRALSQLVVLRLALRRG